MKADADAPNPAPKDKTKTFTPTPPLAEGTHIGNVGSSHRTRRRLLLVGAVLLAIIAITGFFLQINRDTGSKTYPTTEATSPDPDETVECTAAGQTAYQNNDLDIGFCYPANWGAASAADARAAIADEGSRWQIRFADKPNVQLSVLSTDWRTVTSKSPLCADLGVPYMPTGMFSTEWKAYSEQDVVMGGTRDISRQSGRYLIRENVDGDLQRRVCLEGYMATRNNEQFKVVTMSYEAPLTDTVNTAQKHITDSSILISPAERSIFEDVLLSVKGW